MEPTSGNSGHSRDQVVTVASQDGVCRDRRARLIIACVVVALAVLLALEIARSAPGWLYIAPVTGIVSGLLYLCMTGCGATSPRASYARWLRAWCEHNIELYEAAADWDDEWRRLEDGLAAAAKGISLRRQQIIDRRVFGRLDYLRRTGQS